VHLPKGSLIVFDPVTHTAQFLDVSGEEASERQNLSVIFNNVQVPVDSIALRPGPLRLALEIALTVACCRLYGWRTRRWTTS